MFLLFGLYDISRKRREVRHLSRMRITGERLLESDNRISMLALINGYCQEISTKFASDKKLLNCIRLTVSLEGVIARLTDPI